MSEPSNLSGAPVIVPRTLADLIAGAANLDRIEKLLQALQSLKISVTIGGVTKTAPIQFGERNAIVDLRFS